MRPSGRTITVGPTQQEHEYHELTHLPYRTWCETCVKTRGKQDHHLRTKHRDPVIQVDYGFLIDRNSPTNLTVIFAVDVLTLMCISLVVTNKGGLPYAIAALTGFLYEVGRTYGILQCDGENPIKTLCRRIAADVPGLSFRTTPRYSSQSSGTVGVLQGQVWGMVRTLPRHVEDTYKLELKLTHPIITWIVRHASWVLTRYQLHGDGKSSYERRLGRPFRDPYVNLEKLYFGTLPYHVQMRTNSMIAGNEGFT